MSSKRNITYKCPYCDKRFNKENLVIHVGDKHDDMIPEGYSAFRLVFDYINKKPSGYNGKCIVCGNESGWDENKGKYNRICSNPNCKKKYIESFEKRMINAKGVKRISSTAEGQAKMLANRKISGKYKFKDGVEKTYTGTYEKKALEFMDKVMNIRSEDITTPGPIMEYMFEGKKHIYISDIYYAPYNLIIEIKDGGNNPNMREMKSYRAKQIEKEKYIIKETNFNYLRLTNNDFSQLLAAFMELKMQMSNDTPERVIRINEGVIQEKFIGSEPDILYNKEAFDNGDINICFITGHSGSGKSTLAHSKESNEVEVYELDDLMCTKDRFTMDNLKEYGELIYTFFKKYPNLYKSFDELEPKKNPVFEYEDKLYPGFVDYAIKWAKSHKNKKYIIEGVWILCNDYNNKPYFEPSYFKDYAFYIKGTSAIKSKYRAAIRDSKDSSNKFDQIRSFSKKFFINNWKWYKLDEKRINRFRDYFKNKPETVLSESYIEEASTGLFKKIQKDPEIVETYGFVSSNNIYNENVKIKGFNKWLRGRSELLIIDKDKVYLKKDNKGYSIPGGGWEKDEDHNLSAIRETNEEARIKVKNVSYVGSYASFFEPKDWVKERISEENWWYGEYTELYIGEYDGEFKGHVDKIDQDKKMESGKFYDIKSVYKDLISVHQEALDNIIDESYIEERSLRGNVTLYHGAPDGTHEIILNNSFNNGTKFEKPRTSSFWFINKEYAEMFATGELILEKSNKKIPILIDNDMKTLVDEKYRVEVINYLKKNNCYVYSKDIDGKYVSGGNGINFPEYTLDFPVKPDSVSIVPYENKINSIKFASKSYIDSVIEKYKKNRMTYGNSLLGQLIDNILYDTHENIIKNKRKIKSYKEDTYMTEAMNALMTGFIPGSVDNPNNTYIVNYMQNNVFSGEDPNEDNIGVSDNIKLTNLIVRDKDGVLKRVDESFLKDKDYKVYILEMSIEEVSKRLSEYIDQPVKENFIYETLTGHKLYTKDQIQFESSFIPTIDYYEYMRNFREICDNYFQAKDKKPVEINESTFIPKEVRYFNKSGLMLSDKVYSLDEYIKSKPNKILECLDIQIKEV